MLLVINYRMIFSFWIDVFTLTNHLNIFVLSYYSMILMFVKMKMRDFYLIINDLGYSSKIKEIIFYNETVNKKTFVVPILNSVILLYTILFLISLLIKSFKMSLELTVLFLLNLRNLLRILNSNFFDRNLNWYLKVAKFKLLHNIGNYNMIVEIN